MRFAIILQHANMAYQVQRAYDTYKNLLPSLYVHSRSSTRCSAVRRYLQRANMGIWFKASMVQVPNTGAQSTGAYRECNTAGRLGTF